MNKFSNFNDLEIWQWIIDNGLSIDMGYTAGGPFVDDGTVRIYDPDTFGIIAEGDNVRRAVENYQHYMDE